MSRLRTFPTLSAKLASLSDGALSSLIAGAAPLHSGIGGKSVRVTVDGTPLFVKKVPLTDLERQPGNLESTANLFDLPPHCQYRVSGPGFGVWREVAAHLMTTEWVVREECENFPLLYHWRVLPLAEPEPPSTEAEAVRLAALEKKVSYWANSNAVRRRLEALHEASAYVALFVEHIPNQLAAWLEAKVAESDDAAECAVRFVDQDIRKTNAFMHAHGLTHFDAHFENILTDGERLYFTDFGLAQSSRFELTQQETDFLIEHRAFDRANSAMSFVICLVRSLFGKGSWETNLREYLGGQKGKLPPAVDALIRRDAPTALALKEFFRNFDRDKSTPYPAEAIEKLLRQADLA